MWSGSWQIYETETKWGPVASQIQGRVIRHGDDPDFPEFRHEELWERTSVPTYPRFMVGGGYVVSDDVIQALLGILTFAGTEVLTRGPEDVSHATAFYSQALL